MTTDSDDLSRFLHAQEPVFEQVRLELLEGTKRTHWMWFIFPQLRGLGRSDTARHYGLASQAEALAYWQHPTLGPRLKTCVELLLALPATRTASTILGHPDELKLQSSLTLFAQVAPGEPSFALALQRFYGGALDQATLRRLR